MDKMFWAHESTYREFSEHVREHGKGAHYDIPPLPKWVGVKVAWPWAGAAARASFYERGNEDNYVSTYLDISDQLGCMDCKPYFEIYPDAAGDTCRFWLDEQAEMYPAIVKALAKRKRANKRKQAE